MADEKSREVTVRDLQVQALLEMLKDGSQPEREAYHLIVEQEQKIAELERFISKQGGQYDYEPADVERYLCEREKPGKLTIKVDVDVEDAIRALKAVQREARKATQALRELEKAAAKVTEEYEIKAYGTAKLNIDNREEGQSVDINGPARIIIERISEELRNWPRG